GSTRKAPANAAAPPGIEHPSAAPAADSPVLAAAKKEALQQLEKVHAIQPDKRKQAFKRLLRQWHPDKNPPDRAELTTAVFQLLQKESYSVSTVWFCCTCVCCG
ncbi:unnamed protein product, partial [Polarella glacialis]